MLDFRFVDLELNIILYIYIYNCCGLSKNVLYMSRSFAQNFTMVFNDTNSDISLLSLRLENAKAGEAGPGCSSTQIDNAILDQVTCFNTCNNQWVEKMDCTHMDGKCCNAESQTPCPC